MTENSSGVPPVDEMHASILRRSFPGIQRVAIRRELRAIAKRFSDMSYREARRALRYRVRDFAKLYGVGPEVILQAINCSDVSHFIRDWCRFIAVVPDRADRRSSPRSTRRSLICASRCQGATRPAPCGQLIRAAAVLQPTTAFG
jgi:hypothetical protein